MNAVVVTFNKVNLLKECLDSLLNQKDIQKIDLQIYVVDNNSTDGTREFLIHQKKRCERIHLILNSANIGGAGGFYTGIKAAMKNDVDYLWLMDDDTIPDLTALSCLIQAKEKISGGGRAFSYLASKVNWIDGNPCLMNIPNVSKNWTDAPLGFVQLESTTFVSMFIDSKYVENVGLPLKEFFIWGDDIEYSRRLSSEAPGFFVPDSIVVHKMKNNVGTNLLEDERDRIPRYFYDIRNSFYLNRKLGKKAIARFIIVDYFYMVLKLCFRKNVKYRLKKLFVLNKGFWKGISFNPVIEYLDDKC